MANLSIRLKNAPSGANRWGFTIYDWTGAKSLGVTVTSITGEALFDIPPDWAFPLRFWISVVYYPNGSMTVLHQAQSLTTSWPNYVGEFISSLGSYYYNVTTRRFEPIALPIEITAPDSAEAGATVPVSVKVTNNLDYHALFKATIYAVPDLYPDYVIGSIDQTITSGSSVTRNVSFVMPDCNTTIFVYVERNGVWYAVDSKVVSVEIPTPVGVIIRKELEYSGSGDGTVPVSNVPQGVSAKLHVWGRNDMGISQGMGIYWFVADKDGLIAEEYSDWGGTIGPYPKDHEFISSGSFNLNKVGKYTTWIELLMGPQDNPVIVDRYTGDLCTVVAELVPTFSELKILSFSKR